MALIDTLRAYIKRGEKLSSEEEYNQWASEVAIFLEEVVGVKIRNQLDKLQERYFWKRGLSKQLGKLNGLMTRLETRQERAPSLSTTSFGIQSTEIPSKDFKIPSVFIVHGHDNEAKETLARFIKGIGLNPIILHEQPNAGRTIIEKFETYADVSFAVVLLTPDDTVSLVVKPGSKQKRARQNVIFELGFFVGRLGRERVCALVKRGVEIPSDYQGIVYIQMDNDGAWKLKLAKELLETGLPLDMNKLR